MNENLKLKEKWWWWWWWIRFKMQNSKIGWKIISIPGKRYSRKWKISETTYCNEQCPWIVCRIQCRKYFFWKNVGKLYSSYLWTQLENVSAVFKWRKHQIWQMNDGHWKDCKNKLSSSSVCCVLIPWMGTYIHES